MGGKHSIYESNILNKLNPDINVSKENIQNISNKINININDSNLYKRDTSRSHLTAQRKTDPNIKAKKSKKNKAMTKEQRILLKKLLKENVKENKKRIAKNLVGIFLASQKKIKHKVKKPKKKENVETPKSKFIKKEIKRDTVQLRKYASVVNITTNFSKFRKNKKKIEKEIYTKHQSDDNVANKDYADNSNISKLNVNDDTYDDNDDNDFSILNFTSLVKMKRKLMNNK